MKTLQHLAILLCMSYTTSCGIMSLSSCVGPKPQPPPPTPVVTGDYTIREYDVNGVAKHTYFNVPSYQEHSFPRYVTFQYNGETITLEGSYQISKPK